MYTCQDERRGNLPENTWLAEACRPCRCNRSLSMTSGNSGAGNPDHGNAHSLSPAFARWSPPFWWASSEYLSTNNTTARSFIDDCCRIQTWNWAIGSPGQWVIWVIGSSFLPAVRPEFFRFSKKCPKCKTYIWNGEMTKVIVRCLLLKSLDVSQCNELLLLPMIIKNYLAW